MAVSKLQMEIPMLQSVDITSQCSISSGTISSVRYLQEGHLTALFVQVNGITFDGNNIWMRLPNSFPGNADCFAPLATAFDGMVCVFRTQSGSGKYLLIQCSTNATLNLSASGVCLN